MRQAFTLILFFFLLDGLSAQDIHFSQFQAAPLHYNPAYTGQFNADYRLSAIQRTQWRSVTEPFVTFGFAGDVKEAFGRDDYAAGLFIMQDRAGDSRFNTFQLNGSLAKRILLPKRAGESLSIGAQVGFTRQSIDLSQLRFDNQWNGIQYSPSLSTQENLRQENFSFLQLNFGAAYFKEWSRRERVQGGLSVYQWHAPGQSFYDDEDVRLNPRIGVQFDGSRAIDEHWDIQGAFMLSFQSSYREVLIGAQDRYVLMDDDLFWRTLYAGVYFRTRDAGYIVAGMEYDQWKVGLSYDINYSDLEVASQNRGGFEISVVYLMNKFRPPTIKERPCPDYL
ncbi:MAG: PorP/SprF family type IX secretion system membrane protein [Flavobacteriales bacterium]|nr:PorP/SprF family type IX secretion system membrane protein [Flavobacteriales bacterium]